MRHSVWFGAIAWFWLAGTLFAQSSPALSTDAGTTRPNIVWITAEDMSPTLGCYGDPYAHTPALDHFAKQSTRYSHAFASSPVCSPSRACLIHGVPATSQGTHPMRSQMPLPDEMNGLPELLRQSGYFTSNNVKTDYNTAAEDRIKQRSWDRCSPDAHWRDREGDEPFFSVFNLMTSHQSRTMVWPYEQFEQEIQSKLDAAEIHDPDQAPVPPYYPDTPLVRKTIARYYDCVTLMDRQVGEILDQLSDDGLADQTIVFFYSDHGSGMPRHKRALYDSGMRVPLMIRFPERYRRWAPSEPGQWTDQLVCFADFLPTVLSLAGVDALPESVSGLPFLGPLKNGPRQYVFGHRDRVDEIVDTARSVRSGRFLYIRNYMPHLGWNQQNAWCDQGEIRKDFYALADSQKATPAQQQYLSGSRPREELYDCEKDQLNLTNLAESSTHTAILRQLRTVLNEHLIATKDLGFVPEIELKRISQSAVPMLWRQSAGYDVTGCVNAASLVGTDHLGEIRRAFQNADPSIRYWAAVACTAAKRLDEDSINSLRGALRDTSVAVRIEAAGAMIRHGYPAEGYPVLEQVVTGADSNETEILYAARTIELLADPSQHELMQSLSDRFGDAPGDMAWFIRFSTTGYLSRLADSP